MKLLVLLLLVGTAGAAGGLLARQFLPPPAQPSRADFPSSPRMRVAALGRLEPQGEVLDIGAPAGDRVERLTVAEGQQVRAGDVLAYLASHAERLAEKEHVAGQLAEARARLAAETVHADALVREAEVALQQVEKVQPLDIRAQETKVRGQEADLADARSRLHRMTALKPSGAASAQDHEHQAMLVRRGQEELNNACAILDRLKAAREIDLLRARAQLETARAARERARAAQPVESLAKQLLLAEARLALTVIRAPTDGQVFKIRTHPGEATGVRPILRMGDTTRMVAVAEVYHTDARFVRIGQKATVTSPALPRPLTGVVEHVGALIFKNDVLNIDPTADVDARVVEVRVRLDPDATAARLTHLQVHVEIHIDDAAGR